MSPTQKRTITLICNHESESTAAILLDFHRAAPHRELFGVPRKEIIAYAHDRCGLNKGRLNTEMKDDHDENTCATCNDRAQLLER